MAVRAHMARMAAAPIPALVTAAARSSAASSERSFVAESSTATTAILAPTVAGGAGAMLGILHILCRIRAAFLRDGFLDSNSNYFAVAGFHRRAQTRPPFFLGRAADNAISLYFGDLIATFSADAPPVPPSTHRLAAAWVLARGLCRRASSAARVPGARQRSTGDARLSPSVAAPRTSEL
jgi:hypothetical protein